MERFVAGKFFIRIRRPSKRNGRIESNEEFSSRINEELWSSFGGTDGSEVTEKKIKRILLSEPLQRVEGAKALYENLARRGTGSIQNLAYKEWEAEWSRYVEMQQLNTPNARLEASVFFAEKRVEFEASNFLSEVEKKRRITACGVAIDFLMLSPRSDSQTVNSSV